MRNINGFKWICALSVVAITVQADIIIDNQTIPASDVQSITISPASGDVFISTTPGYTISEDNTQPPPSGTVAITTFSVSPSIITEGQSTTLSWVTENAVSCTPSDGVGGWPSRSIGLPGGSTSVTINPPGGYNFTLTCTGAGSETAVRNRTVTVNALPSPSGNCSNPPLSGNVVSWNSFWGVNFPNPGYDTILTTLPQKGYLAIEFNTADIVDNGAFLSIESTATSGSRFGAVSECPGDFNVASECSHRWGLGGGIGWATNDTAGACQLDPAKTYYFNITFTDGFDASSSKCGTTPCKTSIRHINP
jgi:hypothetical protein